jgi:hypothetical protein
MHEWRYSTTVHDIVTNGRKGSDSRPDRFTAEETATVTLWIRDWVGSSVGLNAVEYRTIS